jgi:hypothetical protein
MHNYIWCPYYLPGFMKFCSVVSEELRWQTVWRTDGQRDRRTDGQDKNNMSPHKSEGRHNTLCPFELRDFPNLLLKQLVSATPLKLPNRISWNLVDSKDTICSCAYYQEILISWNLWELCPFELRNFLNILLKQLVGTTPLKLLNRISHNYIWCPYYLPSFMKFCSVVSEELCWQAASEVYFGKF